MDHSLPGSTVHGLLQARMLEWVVMSSSRASSQPRNRTWASLFLKFIYFFNWKIIAVQNYMGFCQTLTWISHRNTYAPSPLEPPSYLLPHPTSLGCYKALVWVSWVIQQIPIGGLFSTWWCKFPCYSLHIFRLLLPSPPIPCPHVHNSASPLLPNK